MSDQHDGHGPATFEDELEYLGFVGSGASRRGGAMWTLAFNSYLNFTVHDYRDHVVLTWSFALGEYLESKGWQVGSGETSFHEIYPRRDSRLAADADAVRGEITRVLTTLRLDLGDPSL